MKIRSITVFIHPGRLLQPALIEKAGKFIQTARPAFEALGVEVQSCRLATVPFWMFLDVSDLPKLVKSVEELEQRAHQAGFDYLAIGPASPAVPSSYQVVTPILAETQNVFLSGHLTSTGQISTTSIRACAEIIHSAARLSPDGFTNLRFAALANVLPNAPFFPAAYHEGNEPAFALALEAADLAVEAFTQAGSLEAARQALIQQVERQAETLSLTAKKLQQSSEFNFKGLDFTLSPFPEKARSLGTALEALGVAQAGLHGSLASAAILTSTLDQARYPRVGFNGLMLPVLEDATLAQAASQGSLSVKDLILLSAVCGTGLDTIPLAGSTSVDELYAVLIDLAALALRLDKPLTARLMPIPGKNVGDETQFDFAYFANSRVLPLSAQPLDHFLIDSEKIWIKPRRD